MKFAEMLKGKRARNTVRLPLGDARADETGAFVGEGVISVDVRVLTGSEQLGVLERARKAAQARGVEVPEDGDPIYDAILVAETLCASCVDTDSPLDAPRPFFDSVEQIHDAPDLTADHKMYLYEQALAWDEACSPRLQGVEPGQAIALVTRLANADLGESARFLCNCRPGFAASFLHFTVKQLWALLPVKSLPSSPFEATN